MFVSSYPPTPCGLATFTQDLANAVDKAAGGPISNVVEIVKGESSAPEDNRVVYRIENGAAQAYRDAAIFCNHYDCDLVSIQHEFGLYTGEWGRSILDFVHACTRPIVTTFHTLPLKPEVTTVEIVSQLSQRSRRVVVMAGVALRILEEAYDVSPEEVEVIPHGVHDVSRGARSTRRKRPTIKGSPTLVTFGLLSPNKGIEHMIDALPAIARRYPQAVYLVVGATHPVVKSEHGESYREGLAQRANELGVSGNIRFVNRFLSLEELLDYIHMADIHVTPYVGREQIVSGALAYALAAGKATVATPYLYAEEMAGRDALLLADFQDGRSLASSILRILDSPLLRKRLERNAWRTGRQMVWRNVGEEYYKLFAEETEDDGAVQEAAAPHPLPLYAQQAG
jgi:glycosyltransferase involved in cell wall biosynthesis